MPLVASPWDAISAFLVFFMGLGIAISACQTFHTPLRRSVLLYVWHTVFCVAYAFYINEYGGDALGYYETALQGDIQFSLGTDSVSYITTFFAYVLGLSFLGSFLVFNIVGFLGLLAFDASLRFATAESSGTLRALATMYVLLPSVSFWSSAIGKDSLAFMSTGFALWAALALKSRVWLMVMAIVTMLLVRPHIAGMMVLALAMSLVISRQISIGSRLLLGGAAIVAAVVMVPIGSDYAGLNQGASTDDLVQYIEQRQQYNLEGAGAIDIASMSLPMQLFTYLFRPLPHEAFSIPSLAASLDNIMLLVLFATGGLSIFFGRKRRFEGNRIFLWTYSILLWTMLAMNTANLGISVRQKWMFAPIIIFLLISAMGKPRIATRRWRSSHAQTDA